ncbi:hypothetical protein [Paenibacillus taihuensis]|nr:hypothetical protein [Paenibacillus taihuensis]
MRFIASFNYSLYLEKAITALESLGVNREDIFVAPLEEKGSGKTLSFDTIERSDGKSLFDGIALFAAFGCFMGSVYGRCGLSEIVAPILRT